MTETISSSTAGAVDGGETLLQTDPEREEGRRHRERGGGRKTQREGGEGDTERGGKGETDLLGGGADEDTRGVASSTSLCGC